MAAVSTRTRACTRWLAVSGAWELWLGVLLVDRVSRHRLGCCGEASGLQGNGGVRFLDMDMTSNALMATTRDSRVSKGLGIRTSSWSTAGKLDID